ncbi:MAG: GspH/FimT family pseudopilin [Alphaproteobacteria bacterium]|nr:GspH/FimT family pseudopilin [Alphaproteobacteria bacterium]
MHRAHGRAAGFTLLELLVVMSLLELVALFAVPRFQAGMPRAEVTAKAQSLAVLLRRARAEALRTGRPVDVRYEPEARRFVRSDGQGAYTLPPEPTLALSTVRLAVPLPPQTLRFFGDGSANGGVLRLEQGTAGAEVRVDWMTGSVDGP